ncbi:glucose-induced degradation protein 8 [Artemisia annua]|uniref:Glucose-induced degradation protein 8 n=1 Tax=Artemisia annua TaxID=35608 RepID=A0A2U1PRP2_ARTAN|nr:glucose-induced degradation protein 8 [Artemisia annua]
MGREIPQVNSEYGLKKKEITEYSWNEMLKKGKIKKEDMDMLVMDFLVNNELPHVAEAFRKESGCQYVYPHELQTDVYDLLFERQYDEAINHLNEKLGLLILFSVFSRLTHYSSSITFLQESLMEEQLPQIEPENVPRGVIVLTPIKEDVSEDDWNELFKKGKFKKADMDMMVMDFLVNKEFAKVAETFHKESGCPLGIEDLSPLGIQKIVRDLILNRQFDEVISLLNEKFGSIFLKDRPEIIFHLEQQKMIEMCRRRDFEAALAFSREFIKWDTFEYKNDRMKSECRRTLLLMMYGDDKESPAAVILDPGRCFRIGKHVVKEMIRFQGRETELFLFIWFVGIHFIGRFISGYKHLIGGFILCFVSHNRLFNHTANFRNRFTRQKKNNFNLTRKPINPKLPYTILASEHRLYVAAPQIFTWMKQLLPLSFLRRWQFLFLVDYQARGSLRTPLYIPMWKRDKWIASTASDHLQSGKTLKSLKSNYNYPIKNHDRIKLKEEI